MSRIAKPFVWIASLAMLAGIAHAAVTDVTESPYKVILTRNAFSLKPPPPPPPPVETETGPPPNVKLTGIISITPPKRAMFKVEPPKGEPIYLTVNEGEHSDGALLKVLEIDELLGAVKITMNGATHTLDFEKNGIKNVAVPLAPAKSVGLSTIPGMAQPGGVPPASLGDRGIPGQFNSPRSTTPPAPGQPATPSSLQSIPTRSLRVAPTQPQSQLGPAVPEQPLTVEQSVILKKLDETVNQDKINKKQYPPSPPVPGLDIP